MIYGYRITREIIENSQSVIEKHNYLLQEYRHLNFSSKLYNSMKNATNFKNNNNNNMYLIIKLLRNCASG